MAWRSFSLIERPLIYFHNDQAIGVATKSQGLVIKHSFWSLRHTVNTVTIMPKRVDVSAGQGDSERNFEQL